MAPYKRSILLALTCLGCVPAMCAGEEKAGRSVKVEFRWLESKQISGVTEESGIRASESGELSYLHKRPVLTADDVLSAKLETTDARANGFPDLMFTVNFR